MPRGIEAGERIADPGPGDDAVGRDLGEGNEHERAFEQARMRQCEPGLVERDVVIGEDVDIDRPRAPAPLALAVAAEHPFDR